MATTRRHLFAEGLVLAVVAALSLAAQNAFAADADSAQDTVLNAADGMVQPAQFRHRPCPPAPCPLPVPGQIPAEEAAPAEKPMAEMPAEAAAPPSALAGGMGAAAGPESAFPNMIGDFFGGGARFFGRGQLANIQNASVGIAGGDRRYKIIEGNSPVPTDRLFLNYNHFQNPLLDIEGNDRNLERFTFGLEKTFFDGMWSAEVRLPLSSDYNSTQSMSGGGLSATEFGDVAVALKRVILRRENFLLSTGLGMAFPTGDDWRIVDDAGTVVEVANESVHLQPFLGAAWRSDDNPLFCLFFTQIDFDTQGNSVRMRNPRTSNGSSTLDTIGVFQEQNLLFVDIALGYWIYRNHSAHYLTGIAPIVELHYSTTLQNEDYVSGLYGSIGANSPQSGSIGNGRRDVLNLTSGLQFELGRMSSLTVAGVAPLRTGEDREYDAEFVVQFNRRF
jgi:hypothetical protein